MRYKCKSMYFSNELKYMHEQLCTDTILFSSFYEDCFIIKHEDLP